jgi:hypothetical protein
MLYEFSKSILDDQNVGLPCLRALENKYRATTGSETVTSSGISS